ncbi:protein painting of fourth isoform X2 [Drosophila gunungcola]|uniref:RRM domain-containing protein n=1 Tax=Drosophila gunungcola TaxID=103775 RepID=A0A9P9YMN6_9MUSC|nr:protein painting of fourth isoform X2 [Drosophila gunungcola]KAI8039828.1 hypothetical protein M5D96_007252 [Drosophila gunungcola]
MDSKRAALEAGDGPVSKRLNSTEDQGRIIGVMEPSPGDGNQLILGKHVAPYTANGCTPPPEAYLFETTPAGSQLLPWNSAADGPTSDNDAELENSTTDNKKPDTAKMSRRELAKLRRENTLRALALERELTNKSTATVALLIRFPDPDISAPMLAGISREIQDVVLPASVAPRHCLVHLRVGADVEATIREINRVRFGTGYLEAEVKPFTDEEQAEFIDPCSLYVGNIPFNMTTSAIKAYFINAVRVDIRALKREKRARYAFVRYASPDHTIEAFRELVNCPLNSRTLTVRYRRLRKHAGLPTVQCTSFYHRMPSPNGGDDDNADCKVITPPPVESIIISDSDNCSDSSGGGKGRSKRKDKDKMNDQEKEIQKLKRQMAEYGAIIKNLQVQQNILGDSLISDLTPKIESCGNPSACIIGSNAVHLMRDIKTECAYLGIPENGTAVQESAGKPTAHSLDENRKKAKSPSRRRKSAKLTSGKYETLRTSPEKDDRLEELYAQLECDPDP